jgi:hypothetical protein
MSKITLRKVQKTTTIKNIKLLGGIGSKEQVIFLEVGGVRLSESAGMREQRSEAQRVL